MKNEIITLSAISLHKTKFKSEALSYATQQIADIYADAVKYADEKNREIAKILNIVAVGKAYGPDGFTSVADYAYKVFGIAKANAYALATAGAIYNDETAPDTMKQFTPSKLAEIASLPRDTVASAIESGEISPKTTQKELREYKQRESAKISGRDLDVKVLDTYTARPCMVLQPEVIANEVGTPRLLEDWDTFFSEQLAGLTSSDTDTVEIVKLSKGYATIDAKKPTVNRKLYFNRSYSLVVEFYKYTPKPVSDENEDKPVVNYTVEELEAMLAAARESAASDESHESESAE